MRKENKDCILINFLTQKETRMSSISAKGVKGSRNVRRTKEENEELMVLRNRLAELETTRAVFIAKQEHHWARVAELCRPTPMFEMDELRALTQLVLELMPENVEKKSRQELCAALGHEILEGEMDYTLPENIRLQLQPSDWNLREATKEWIFHNAGFSWEKGS